jgi:glycosyltransferase involved in cell wall biosynthesis
MVPWITMALRFGRRNIAYLGDPVLAWELKRLQRIHRAKVVFMNGMRLSPSWARAFDGVHLLADPYLRDARRELEEGGADTRGFFAVPHFTNLAVFRPASQTERLAARSSLGLPPDAFVVLTLGPIGLTSRKRLDHLAREVAASSTEARLVHAGGGEDGEAEVRAAVNAALGHRIHWKGRVDRGAVGALLAAADAYSLASLAEPFSIAILEALASGIPVVHHDEPVMRWQTGAGGVAVSMEEPGLAAAVFRGLAANPEQRARLGTCARALAESRYSPGPVCAALLEGLHTVAP